MSLSAVQPQSMFATALPYGAATLAVGVVGAITAIGAVSTIGIIMGIALGVLGGYGFIGVLSCAFASRNADEFNQNVWKHMATAAGVGASDIIVLVVKSVIMDLIFNRKRA